MQTVRFYPFVFTGEERNEETCYGYCNDYQPHAVKRMFDYSNGMLYDLRWDEAGNLGQVSMAKPDEMFEAGRFLFWTEDNRMHVAADDRYYSYYTYDHSGERRLKLTGDNKLLDVNADIMATYTLLNEPTLYPSAYMVLTNKGYTKHYYAGTERVAARLGGGGLDALFPVIGNEEDLQTKADLLFDQSLEQVNNRVLQENDLECIKNNEFTKDEFGHSIDGIPHRMQSEVILNHEHIRYTVRSMQDDPNEGEEPDVYFYHSDHLGSASWITDGDGMPVQHLQYLPYGAPFVNQRAAGYNERFTFTGKERDEETGYSYFGARYMDHELMTMWLSVDPLSDKYPSISPYAYCAWNPIRLVDPDGREIGDFVNENGDVIGSDGKDDGKKYLLKMVRPTPRKTDSEADNSLFGISADKRKETEEFIRNNTGNESAFTDDCIAYENSILISTTKDEFAEMRSLCKDENNALFNHEIGGLKCTDGNIYGGNDGTAPGIAIGTETNVQIKRNRELSYRYWFHLHLDDRSKYQMPSPADLKTFPDLIGYTISFRDRRIYVTTGGRCEGYITFGGTTKF